MNLPVPKPTKFHASWYDNSWDALPNPNKFNYEQFHNVKLVIDDVGQYTHVNFPTEADATLFVLRWS